MAPSIDRTLWRLVYRSDSCIDHADTESLDEIFRTSVTNNRRDGITGCLALPDGKFVQVIEGARSKVGALMDRIRADVRHRELAVLDEWAIQNRLFTGWAMARPDPTPLNDQAFRIITRTGGGAQVTGLLSGLTEQTETLFRSGSW
ncbi:MAG: BLUF domain-containing protein [Brevundimonas sp.]|uniref:BLUF domain-containing protein n=1 Tax=Brevundimonas sp. TaxID=1871086 RepID=UPI00391D2889